MLVGIPRQHVVSLVIPFEVTPVPVSGKLSAHNKLPASGVGAPVLDVRIDASTAHFLAKNFLFNAKLGILAVFGSLGISRIVSLFISCHMHLGMSPSVYRVDVRALRLEAEHVYATHKTEESVLSVMVSPRVSHEPVLHTVLDTITNDRYVVIDVLRAQARSVV